MKSVKRMIDSAKAVCRKPTKCCVADYLGIDQRRLDEYERGKRHMPAHLVMRLATIANENAVIALGRYEAEWAGKKLQRATVGIAVLAATAVVSLPSPSHGLARYEERRGKATAAAKKPVNPPKRVTQLTHYAQRTVARLRRLLTVRRKVQA